VAPATGIDATRAYSDVPEARRWREAAEAEAAWLRGQLTTAAGPGGVSPVFAVRYVNERTDGLLDAYLLWRAEGADGDSAGAAASAAGRALAAVPRHLAVAPLIGPEEVTQALRPFTPHASGLAEIRKSLTGARTLRADAGTGVLVAIGSFAVGGRSWEPLWAQLAELPFPAMVTISLTALAVTPHTNAVFRQVADTYARLGRPGPAATAIYGRPAAPDSFAAQAASSYADMARRYVTGRDAGRAGVGARRPARGRAPRRAGGEPDHVGRHQYAEYGPAAGVLIAGHTGRGAAGPAAGPRRAGGRGRGRGVVPAALRDPGAQGFVPALPGAGRHGLAFRRRGVAAGVRAGSMAEPLHHRR
jgi:hypothetical protein